MLGRARKGQQAETRSVGKEGAWVLGKWAGRKVSDRNPGPCRGLLGSLLGVGEEKRVTWTGRLFLIAAFSSPGGMDGAAEIGAL